MGLAVHGGGVYLVPVTQQDGSPIPAPLAAIVAQHDVRIPCGQGLCIQVAGAMYAHCPEHRAGQHVFDLKGGTQRDQPAGAAIPKRPRGVAWGRGRLGEQHPQRSLISVSGDKQSVVSLKGTDCGAGMHPIRARRILHRKAMGEQRLLQ